MPALPLPDDRPYPTTRKRLVMQTLVDICKRMRGGRYYVKRGSVNWASFPFTDYPFAVCVLADEVTAFMTPGQSRGTLTLEMMVQVPHEVNQSDDAVLDDLFEDAFVAFAQLSEAREPDDESFPVITMLDQGSARAMEVSDTSMRVQGLVVSVTVQF